MIIEEDEKVIVEILAMIYCKIKWREIRTSKNPHDIFNHRVRSATRRATLYEFVSKLSNYFSIQSLPGEINALLDKIRPKEIEILNVLSREHILFCVRAFIRAKEIKKDKWALYEEMKTFEFEEVNKDGNQKI
ncbi:MAG: hypothetical protein ACOYWZ_04480 [Bacillota bacterium]